MSLIGTLSDVKVGDVLRLFSTGKKTGLLTVSATGHEAALHFVKGAIVNATAGRLQGEDAVLDLFGWREGQLTFVPNDRPVVANIQKATDALILEGLRVGDSLHRMAELIPSDRVVFQMGPGPPGDPAPFQLRLAAWRVLRHLDGLHDVRELIELSRLPKPEVTRVLFELFEAGLLERVEPVKSLRVQTQGLFGKDTAELDEKVQTDWRKLLRFVSGVQRVELRSLAGRSITQTVSFRSGLIRDIHLSRSTLTELAVREGDEVSVRPVG